jgi:hypothetical protein
MGLLLAKNGECDLWQRTDSFLFITCNTYRILLLQGFD